MRGTVLLLVCLIPPRIPVLRLTMDGCNMLLLLLLFAFRLACGLVCGLVLVSGVLAMFCFAFRIVLAFGHQWLGRFRRRVGCIGRTCSCSHKLDMLFADSVRVRWCWWKDIYADLHRVHLSSLYLSRHHQLRILIAATSKINLVL